MLTANSRKNDETISIQDGTVLNHLLNFFNINELAKLREISPNWQYYIENQLFLFKPKTKDYIQAYLKDFIVYQFQNEYLVHFNIQDLCYKNSPKLFKDFPFIKDCLAKARGSLVHVHITLWSPDGINFILLYPDQSCKTHNGRLIKVPGVNGNCLIEFNDKHANIHQPSDYLNAIQDLESNSDATDESEETSEEILDFNPLEIQRIYPLPEHKKHSTLLRSLKRCNPGIHHLILAGLKHNKLLIHYFKNDFEITLNPLDQKELNYDAYRLRRRWPG